MKVMAGVLIGATVAVTLSGLARRTPFGLTPTVLLVRRTRRRV
jgi:hypothetical protein